jgi:cytochrome c oxidase subunit II
MFLAASGRKRRALWRFRRCFGPRLLVPCRVALSKLHPLPVDEVVGFASAILGVAGRTAPAFLVALGCSGQQSALAPAGEGAERLAGLFWTVSAGAVVIWVLVVGAAVYASRVRPGPHRERTARAVLWGGTGLSAAVLAGLLTYGLMLMPDLRAAGDGLKIAVSGEQWWWRVRYLPPGRSEPIESANEVRLPLGRRVEFELTSPDVIHSFWIPPLGGKVDMIPGRTTRLVLESTRTGAFRGACAEFCGTSHALMAFSVVVLEEAAFEDWLAKEAAAAPAPASPDAARGQELFLQVGCGACHTVRGTEADGTIGPDLTHLASRATLGAGTLSNDFDDLVHWIAHTEEVKPSVRMPSFGALPKEHIEAIAAYLKELE